MLLAGRFSGGFWSSSRIFFFRSRAVTKYAVDSLMELALITSRHVLIIPLHSRLVNMLCMVFISSVDHKLIGFKTRHSYFGITHPTIDHRFLRKLHYAESAKKLSMHFTVFHNSKICYS
jgi:hypothetical protein